MTNISEMYAKCAEAAELLATKAQHYAATLSQAARSPNRLMHYGIICDAALVELCNAAEAVADDGDFNRMRQEVCDNNCWDSEGYPVDEDGNRVDGARFMAPWERGI